MFEVKEIFIYCEYTKIEYIVKIKFFLRLNIKFQNLEYYAKMIYKTISKSTENFKLCINNIHKNERQSRYIIVNSVILERKRINKVLINTKIGGSDTIKCISCKNSSLNEKLKT